MLAAKNMCVKKTLKTTLVNLSCESIIRYGMIGHHKMISKAKTVLDRNVDILNSYRDFIDSTEKRIKGEI